MSVPDSNEPAIQINWTMKKQISWNSVQLSGLAGVTGTMQTSTHCGLNAQSATSPTQHKGIPQNFDKPTVLTICRIPWFKDKKLC